MTFNTETNHVLQACGAQNATGLQLFVRDEICSFRALHFESLLRYCSMLRHSQDQNSHLPDLMNTDEASRSPECA